jgi:hypothetical protein
MKTYFAKAIIFIIICATSITCKKPNEGVSLNINADITKYSVLVTVSDAQDDTKTPANISMVIEGVDAEAIYESGGTKKFEFGDGKITLISKPSAVVSDNDPLKFKIVIAAEGYLPVNYPVTINPDQNQQMIEISLVSKSNPPAGVTSATASFSLNNGAMATNGTITTPLENDKTENAQITIPANTKFYDKNGTQITGGNLSAEVLHFDSKSVESLNSYPGSFVAEDAILADGSKENITFVTAGFVSVDMKIGSSPVKKFDKPVTISMGVSNDVINPETGMTAKEGDIMPIWSYEVSDGQWKFEKNATIVKVNGVLTVSFTTDHLTWFNMDYYSRSCTQSARFRINTNGNSGMYYFEYYLENQPYPFYTREMYVTDRMEFGYYRIPSAKFKLVISKESWRNATYSYRINQGWSSFRTVTYSYLAPFKKVIAETPYTSFCNAAGTITNVNFQGASAPPIFKIDFTGKCSNKSTTIKPSVYIQFQEVGKSSPRWANLGYMSKGHLETTQLEIGKTYNFRAWYSNSYFKATHKIEKTDYKETVILPGSICNSF